MHINGDTRQMLDRIYAELEAIIIGIQDQAEVERLRDALAELRTCSRAKIGMEDDFACADAQMRAALARAEVKG